MLGKDRVALLWTLSSEDEHRPRKRQLDHRTLLFNFTDLARGLRLPDLAGTLHLAVNHAVV